jgi:hypothetical protein
MYDRKSCSGQGADWAGFMFSRGVLINKRLGLRFTARGLERLPYLHEVFSRWEAARLRYQHDGISLEQAWRMLQGGAPVLDVADTFALVDDRREVGYV